MNSVGRYTPEFAQPGRVVRRHTRRGRPARLQVPIPSIALQQSHEYSFGVLWLPGSAWHHCHSKDFIILNTLELRSVVLIGKRPAAIEQFFQNLDERIFFTHIQHAIEVIIKRTH